MNRRILVAGLAGVPIFFIAVGLLALTYTQGTISPQDVTPRYDDCPITSNGQQINQCGWSRETVSDLGDQFSRSNSEFRVKISDVEPYGESQAPYVLYLWHQGYRAQDENRLDDVGPNDVNRSEQVINRLEEGTTCSLSADVASHGEVEITTSETSQVYNDEPDEPGQRHTRYIMDGPVTVESGDIEIHRNYMICRFNMSEILDKGMELDGQFQRWEGREAVVGDETGSTSSVSVQFGLAEKQQPEPEPRPEPDPGQNDSSNGSTSPPDNDDGGPVDQRSFLEKLIDFLQRLANYG